MIKASYKRRHYFIKKNFQGKLILGYFLFMVAGCLIFAIILTFLSANSMTVVYQNNDLQVGQTPLMLLKQILMANWISVVVCSVFVVVGAMFITHRLAGPIFRLERAVDNMINKQLDDVIYLREKDEGKELAAKLNQFNQELSGNIAQIRKKSQNIEDLLAQYSSIDPAHSIAEDCSSIYNSITTQNQAIQEIIASYQLIDE